MEPVTPATSAVTVQVSPTDPPPAETDEMTGAPLMPLVEIIPGLRTGADTIDRARALVDGWGKTTVVAKDTPGFIVNRVARPFYGESLRLLEEGVAGVAMRKVNKKLQKGRDEARR